MLAGLSSQSGMNRSIPSATVSRFPVYLRSLGNVPLDQPTISSEQLAVIAGVNSAQVRKDLSFLGSPGVRGVGYAVEALRGVLRQALGLTHGYAVAIVGAGNLGAALGNYTGFEPWGFEVVAILDRDRTKVGSEVANLEVESMSDLEKIVTARAVSIGIIATPASSAQEVADRFTAAGVKSILNFAPAVLQVEPGVQVRRVDLSTELQILTFHLQETGAVR